MWAMRRQDSGDVKYCWPVSCLVAGTSHRPELRLEAAIALPRGATGHERLRVDAAPVLELRRHVDVGNALDIGRLIDRGEQAAALEIVGDDLRDAVADSPSPCVPGTKFGIAIGIGWKLPSVICDARLRQRLVEQASPSATRPMPPPDDQLPARQIETDFRIHARQLVCHLAWSCELHSGGVAVTSRLHENFSVKTGSKNFHSSK